MDPAVTPPPSPVAMASPWLSIHGLLRGPFTRSLHGPPGLALNSRCTSSYPAAALPTGVLFWATQLLISALGQAHPSLDCCPFCLHLMYCLFSIFLNSTCLPGTGLKGRQHLVAEGMDSGGRCESKSWLCINELCDLGQVI